MSEAACVSEDFNYSCDFYLNNWHHISWELLFYECLNDFTNTLKRRWCFILSCWWSERLSLQAVSQHSHSHFWVQCSLQLVEFHQFVVDQCSIYFWSHFLWTFRVTYIWSNLWWARGWKSRALITKSSHVMTSTSHLDLSEKLLQCTFIAWKIWDSTFFFTFIIFYFVQYLVSQIHWFNLYLLVQFQHKCEVKCFHCLSHSHWQSDLWAGFLHTQRQNWHSTILTLKTMSQFQMKR